MDRRREDILSGTFFLLCAAGLGYQAVRLGLGQVGDPGPGFTIFLAAAALGLLSLGLTLASLFGKRRESEEPAEDIRWGNIGLILLSLIFYGVFLQKLGFVLSTFFLVIFFLKVSERKSWRLSFLFGVGMALGMYVVFELWLQARLPAGFWGV